MQDRYAGDIGDFGKFGLLKALQAQGLTIGVNWYWVPTPESELNPDGSYKQKDGKHPIPKKYRECDEGLAAKLTEIADPDNQDRSVHALENANLVPGAVYFREQVPIFDREDWQHRAMETLKDADVVFLDPDNGLLVKSVKKESDRSVKYVYYEEVCNYLNQAHPQSVLVYNHRCRKPKDVYFREICGKLHNETDIPESRILKITFPRYSIRDYFAVCATEEHYLKIKAAFDEMVQGVWGQTAKGMCYLPE